MHHMEQSLELNEMPEVVEGVNILVCGSIYAHDHVIDYNCEVVIPLNGNALRDHQVHGTGHA